MFGGSWGSTLALAYAATHPERVEALILRGVFLLTQRELRLVLPGRRLDDLPRRLGAVPGADPRGRARRHDRRLPPPADPRRPRGAGARRPRPGASGRATPSPCADPQARPAKFNEAEFAVAFARIESHYFVNGGFFPEDGWLLKQVDKLRGIPCRIVQGRFDVVTPMSGAWSLKQAWPEASLEIVWDAGHASTEPGIVDALVRATDRALG